MVNTKFRVFSGEAYREDGRFCRAFSSGTNSRADVVPEPFKSHLTDPAERLQDVPLLGAPAAEGIRGPDLEAGDVLHFTGQTEECEDLGDHLGRLVAEILKTDPQVLCAEDGLPVVRSQQVEATPEGD